MTSAGAEGLTVVDAQQWDSRYASRDLVWGTEPNRWVAEVCGPLAPGRALDVACGEGRNALWLAGRGWQVLGVDFSGVALERADRLAGAAELSGTARWERADLLAYRPEAGAFDLVVVAYLQLPAEQRRTVLRAVADGVAPGGSLLVVAHDSANLRDGVGGPQDPRVLYTAEDVVADLAGADGREPTGLDVVRAEPVRRPVAVDDGTRDAIDALVLARRPG